MLSLPKQAIKKSFLMACFLFKLGEAEFRLIGQLQQQKSLVVHGQSLIPSHEF